jgi:hypothetical protein
LADVLKTELEEQGFTRVPAQIQGLDNWRGFLESEPEVTAYLFAKFKKMITPKSIET